MDQQAEPAEAVSPAEPVANWYSSQHPIKLDLIGDLVGRELFAIHGDSLLLHCITEAKVDFDNGPQVMHAVHAIEAFLQKIKEHGCHYHILWFQADKSLWDNASRQNQAKYLLVRAIVIEHLMREAAIEDGTPFNFVFPSMSSAEFDQYLMENTVRNFMIHDGARKRDVPLDNSLNFQSLIMEASRRRYTVALINYLQFASSKMATLVISPSSKTQVVKYKAPELAETDSARVLHRALAAWSKEQGDRISAREVVSLTCIDEILKNDTSQTTKEFCVALLVQLVVLKSYTLSNRSCRLPRLLDQPDAHEEALQFIAKFSSIAEGLTSGWFSDESLSQLTWDLYDLVDGRVFHEVHKNLARNGFDSGSSKELADLFEMVEDLTGFDLSPNAIGRPRSSGGDPEPTAGNSTTDSHQCAEGVASGSVLAFSHPVLDAQLKDVKLTTDSCSEPELPARIFLELTHWHNAKKPVDPKHIPKPKGFFARKKNQKFMADTIAYSASLTNAAGKLIESEIIVSGRATKDQGPKVELDWKAALKQQSKRATDKKANDKNSEKKSNKEKALEAARQRQEEKNADKSTAVANFWAERCREFETEKDLVKRYLNVLKYVSGLSPTDLAVVEPEVLLYSCNVLAQLVAKNKETTGLDISAIIWRTTVDLCGKTYSQKVFLGLEKFVKFLKLPSHTLAAPEKSVKVAKALPVGLQLKNAIDSLDLIKDPHEFQMMYCGPYLDRGFNSQPDSRVPFNPDAWQRRVLDAIDAPNKSLFVVAPTSAGKTFISFYAMKKVLQSNDDDVLVYVAPTKALVNQIAAEIQARFEKTYHHEGHSVWAIHTRDYRVNNPTGCQILVTVPHILQIMLLAPSNAEKPTSWSNRVKRIIFDEVHSIGQAGDGIVWEQLLLLAPCPIIALSATVGNPLEFYDWLKGTQKARGFELEMVVHQSRYSDLRKFLYVPPGSQDYRGLERGLERYNGLPLPGLDQGKQNSRLKLLHPICSVVDPNRDTLEDITLEPRDCFTLWESMNKHQTDDFPLDKALDPKKFLPPVLKKEHIVSWESNLKSQLQKWMRNPKSPFLAVRSELQHGISGLLTGSESSASIVGKERFAPTLSLLTDLLARGALPAIIFNFDRSECEEIASKVLDQLTRAEADWKETSKDWKKTMKDFQDWQKGSESNKTRKAPAKTKNSKEDKDDGTAISKMDLECQGASREWSIWESFDPEAPVQNFSFADSTKLSRYELEEQLAKLTRIGIKTQLIHALKRGVGVHHAGMNREYRQVVEILFRKGFLTVVVSTETLALGINMPCKTVVFTGDSVFLTALNYRQASGRAGRRGFDLLGNVVFFQINPERVLEIMSSTLPDLRGQFPVSTTLVLRLLSLLHHTKNSEFAVKAVQSLLSQTRCYLGGPAAQLSIKHHVRFSIEYLRRQHLLAANGTPLNFSGLVGHLYFTENAVFAFHTLLKNGYFHDLCNDIDRNTERVMREIVLVMCHLFCRIPCTRYQDKKWLEKVHRSSSKVILQSLPPVARDILNQHNSETLDIFKTYVATYVDQYLSEDPDCELPFTKIKVGPTQTKPLGSDVFAPLPATRLRSPFAALSGFGDDFGSIHELCSTVRNGVFLEESAMPYIPIYPDETNGVPWNAYILDFFKHGDMQTLVRDNGIKSGDVWFHLKDFSMVLATIVTSLTNFIGSTALDGDAAMVDVQDAADRHEDEKVVKEVLDNEREPRFAANEVAARAMAGYKSVRKTKVSKTVVDSWMDEADERALGETDPFTPVTPNYPDSPPPVSETEGGGTPCDSPPTASVASLSLVQEERPLQKVLRAFKMVQDEFEEKFREEYA